MTFQQEDKFPDHLSVAIVGAGAPGIGVAWVLRDLAIPDVWVLERGQISQSSLDWPVETRPLTPSLPGNVLGITDLKAISSYSSPGGHSDPSNLAGVLMPRFETTRRTPLV